MFDWKVLKVFYMSGVLQLSRVRWHLYESLTQVILGITLQLKMFSFELSWAAKLLLLEDTINLKALLKYINEVSESKYISGSKLIPPEVRMNQSVQSVSCVAVTCNHFVLTLPLHVRISLPQFILAFRFRNSI